MTIVPCWIKWKINTASVELLILFAFLLGYQTMPVTLFTLEGTRVIGHFSAVLSVVSTEPVVSQHLRRRYVKYHLSLYSLYTENILIPEFFISVNLSTVIKCSY